MTFKQFKEWCNERACDGCWSYNTATFCIEVIRAVDKKPFWKREKVWRGFNDQFEIEKTVVSRINAEIEALAKGGVE